MQDNHVNQEAVMKVIAWHLPQFHSIKENDEWWGEGFTEWTNTQKSTPLYDGHHQPREPLDNNYYNMLEKDTMIWQCKISKQYNVDAFCYYHYWFNGRLLLEKPVENLLRWTDIEQEFCLSWANEPWTRSWDGGEKEIIMPQYYGQENEWENHLQYLLPFFKDKRYLKEDGKPIFLIYRTENIPDCNKMIEFWNVRMQEEGFAGIYIVETLNGFQTASKCNNSNAQAYMEPMYTINKLLSSRTILDKVISRIRHQILGKTKTYNYEEMWESVVSRKYSSDHKESFLGAFVDWDNTPRKGSKGMYFLGSTPKKFKSFFSRQVQNAERINSKYIFINAWNEWAEGTYLEPDTKNGYEYLEAIKEATSKRIL